MKRLTALRQERAKLHDRNKELYGIFDIEQDAREAKITDEQISAELTENETKIAELDKQIAPLEKVEQIGSTINTRDAYLNRSVGLPVPPHSGKQDSGEDDRAAHRRGVHSMIQKQAYAPLVNIRGERNGMSAEERAFRLGMWGLAVAARHMPNRYSFPKATKFVDDNFRIVHGEGGSDTTGAYLTVPDEFSADLIDLKEARGVVRRLFGRELMMSDTKTVPRRKGGLTAYPVAESAAGTESNMSFDDIALTAKKAMVLSRMSKELNEDSAINFGDTLAGEIAYAFTHAEDNAGINGDGTSTYWNIRGVRSRLQDVDGAGTDSYGLKTASGNAWSEITLADFHGVLALLPDYADNDNAAWIAHRAFYYNVMQKLELAAGGVTASEIRDGNRRPRPLFLGYPVEFSQVMPSTEANSAVCAVLGDFKTGAKFGDRRQESIEFSDTVTVGGQSVWERDQIAVKGTERFDIVVHEVGTSSAAGAIVGLQTAGS